MKELLDALTPIIKDFEAMGLDLTTDAVELTIMPPDMQGIQIKIKLGGLFTEELDYDEDEVH